MAIITVNGAGGAMFTTIQAAVTAAASGDTIRIASGTYTEQVVVNGKSNLTIEEAPGASVIIKAPADVVETVRSSSDRELHGVVTVVNGTNVTLKGVTVDGDGRANTVDEGGGAGQANFVGVIYRNASGSVLGVDITGIRDPYEPGTTPGGFPIVSGIQRGVGLQVDNDTVMSFTMTGGSISDFQKNATVFSMANLNVSGVTITGNGDQTIIAQNGIQVLDSTGTIAGNTISDIGYAGPADAYSGAILGFDNAGLAITGNIITGSNDVNTDAKVVGVFIIGAVGGSVSGNTISHVDTGIGLYGTLAGGAISVGGNTITDIDLGDPFAEAIDIDPDAGSSAPITGGAGNDLLVGGDLTDDTISGLGGNDTLVGGDGNDSLNGGKGTDAADYSAAATAVIVDLTTGTATGAATGNDTLVSIENLTGGAGGDIITGNSGRNVVEGGAGNDTLQSGSGNDTVLGGGDDDDLFGGAGNDSMDGGAGADLLFGEAGNDQISGGLDGDIIDGGDGNDRLLGGDGIDHLIGGSGNDTLYGEGGADSLDGGAGNDTFVIDSLDTSVNGGIGTDTVIVSGAAGATLDLAASSIEIANGGAAGDGLDGSTATVALTVRGNGGDDQIAGGSAKDRLEGGDGDDSIDGGLGSDVILGGGGADAINGGGGNDRMSGGGIDGALDRFTFGAAWGKDTITDFENGIDKISINGVSSFSELSVTTKGAVTTIKIGTDSANTITVLGAPAGTIDASDFDFGP